MVSVSSEHDQEPDLSVIWVQEGFGFKKSISHLTSPCGCLIGVSDLSSPKLISSESVLLMASSASVAQDIKKQTTTLLRIFRQASFSNSPRPVCQRILLALPLKWIQNSTSYHYHPGPRNPILCLDYCSSLLMGACFCSDLSTL